MSKQSLKKLTIACLRGCTGSFSLPFESGKKLTLLYGESGTGKSSICDAFEFIGKGRIGSLENRGLGRTESYWPSFGKNATEISVTLETDAGSCTGKVENAGVSCDPVDLRPKVEILRRATILDLIEAQPAEKYKAIERFIDVGGAEASEGALHNLIKSLKESQTVALARIGENQSTIEQSWAIDGSPLPDAFTWSETQAQTDTDVLEAESKHIAAIISSFDRLKDAAGAIASGVASVNGARENLEKAKDAERGALQSATVDAAEVVALLESAKTYLHTHDDVEACPLCESAEKIEGLSKRVEARLTAFASLRKVQSAVRSAESIFTAAEARLQGVLETIASRATDFEKIRSTYAWPSDVSLPDSPPPAVTSEIPDWLANAEALLSDWKTAKDRRADRKTFIATVKNALATYKQNLEQQKTLDTLIPKLTEVWKIADAERHAFTDEILSAIAVDVGRLYELVHPGEGLEKISLALHPKRRASLDIGSSFEGKTGVAPQAYLSDSHLDTLGLCVFLALAAIDNPEETILVLDDVLASVDEPHVGRTIEMLYAEALKFRHCIITSHYRPWKQRLQWGWLKNGQIQFVELGEWSNLQGLSLIQAIPDVERLRSFLGENPPDVQSICAKAGYILEAALNFLTLQYECPCPRKAEGRYTLRDYLQAISKKLRDALRVEIVKVDGKGNAIVIERDIKLGPILTEIERIAEARNVFGCHFKELSFDLLDQDGTAFGQQVVALMDALTEPSAGWPSKQQTDHWTTGDKTRRLYPLRRP